MIVSFEGLDGCGKSKQLSLFYAATGCAEIPQFPSLPRITPKINRARMFMKVESARLDLALLISPPDAMVRIEDARVHEKSRRSGHPYDLVALDRSIDTTYSYSALFFQGVDKEEFDSYQEEISTWHINSPKPDLTFLFKVDYGVTLERLKARAGNDNEFDGMPEKQWLQTWERYVELSVVNSSRIKMIDGNKRSDEVHEEVMSVYDNFLSGVIK